MVSVCKTFTFHAAHKLPNHRGKCSRLHGHTYRATVGINFDIQLSDPTDSEYGMGIDFDRVSEVIEWMKEKYLDHYYLNETLYVPATTAELIACWIFGGFVLSEGLTPVFVTVRETETSEARVTYDDWKQTGKLGSKTRGEDVPDYRGVRTDYSG